MFKLVKSNSFVHSFSINFFKFNVRSKTSKKSFTAKMDHTITREWITNPVYRNYKQNIDETVVTVMSYNILAQDLIDKHPYLYREQNPNDLKYDTRSQKLFGEINRIRPDILCLQEMQESHLMELKLKCFSIDLHEVIFKKRTQDSLTDGCAIFYNADLIELMDEHKVEYFQPNAPVLNRPNVAIVAKFRLRSNPRAKFVVATTHLLYNPRRHDVRLAQIQVLLTEIDRMACIGVDQRNHRQYVPVILTGDFNFQPNSAPYALILNGSLTYSSLSKRLEITNEIYEPTFGNVLLPMDLGVTDDCQHFDRNATMLHNSEKQTQEQNGVPVETLMQARLPFATGKLKHQLNLCSVYDNTISVSTYQNSWVLVDYIFYRRELNASDHLVEKQLKLLARFELPSREQCCCCLPYGGIPNESQGSDHYSLAAKFLLSPPNSSE